MAIKCEHVHGLELLTLLRSDIDLFWSFWPSDTTADIWRQTTKFLEALGSLMQLGRYASLRHTIYITADPTPVDVDYAVHAYHRIVRPKCFNDTHYIKIIFKNSE